MISKTETIVRAPGRICLFGDHQDYLGLPIIACAINRFVEIRAIENDSLKFRFDMPDIKSSRSFPINEAFDQIEKGDFIASVLRVANRYGCLPDRGFDISIRSTIPINAGLSSSSAIVVAWVRFLLSTYGCDHEITEELIAKISYEAEVIEHNSPGGRMDQYTIALGDIIYLETDNSSTYEKINCPLEVLIIGESGVPKNTIAVLGDLKEKALRSVEIIKAHIPTFELKNSTFPDIEHHVFLLPEELKPLFSAAIKNFSITKRAYQALKANPVDFMQIGRLIDEHHSILKDELKITTPMIDDMINAANEAGALGAKIVGSGGGGSICALASQATRQKVIDSIKATGAKDAYAVEIASGASIN